MTTRRLEANSDNSSSRRVRSRGIYVSSRGPRETRGQLLRESGSHRPRPEYAELNGRDFYHQAREVGYTGPVLIASAYGARSAQRELGAEAAIDKPFQPEMLAETVKGLVHT